MCRDAMPSKNDHGRKIKVLMFVLRVPNVLDMSEVSTLISLLRPLELSVTAKYCHCFTHRDNNM